MTSVLAPRLSVAAVGVSDVDAAAGSYDRLGWRRSSLSNDEVVWFTTADSTIGLYPKSFLAAEAGVEPPATHPLVTFALDVESRAAVRDVTSAAEAAGALVFRSPQAEPWGGYRAFIRVHDGLVWELT